MSITTQSTVASRNGKPSELNDFLCELTQYKPTFPTAVAKYYLETSGLAIQDERIVKLVSLAVDKFLVDILDEAKNIAAMKYENTQKINSASATVNQTNVLSTNKKRSQESSGNSQLAMLKDAVTVDDIDYALGEFGVLLKKKKLN